MSYLYQLTNESDTEYQARWQRVVGAGAPPVRTATRVCDDCGVELVDLVETWTGSCAGCITAWFVARVANAPATLEAPFGAIWQASAGYSAAAEIAEDCNEMAAHERDDFEDADDSDAEPLPPSDWWQMDLATQDRVTKRQQTGMAGS